MKTRSIAAVSMGLVASLVLVGNPAGAGTSQNPEIVDPAGDANLINGQDACAATLNFFCSSEGLYDGPDTRPASHDGSDLRAIWFETTYDTAKETDDLGNVTAVRYIPRALLVHIKTEGPAVPSPGPTLSYRVPATVGSCPLEFDAHVDGPLTTGLEDSGATIYKWNSSPTCPGGSGGIAHADFKLTTSGNVMTMRYPFSALPYSSTQLVLASDVVIKPREDFLSPAVQTYVNWLGAYGGVIDETHPYGMKFRIGQDVPANIDCIANPERAECVA